MPQDNSIDPHDDLQDDLQDDFVAEPASINDLDIIDEPLADDLEDEDLEEEAPLKTGYFDDISDDSVRLYLREIGKIPLLNSEEELALAQQVVAE